MNNISITIETYVESWVGVVNLDVQCDHRLLLPLILTASAIGRLNYWWIFCQSIPYIWHCCWRTFDVFISLYVLAEYLFHDVPSCLIKQFEVSGIRRPVLLSDIIRDIFMEIIGNRISCVVTSLIFLNSELFSTR